MIQHRVVTNDPENPKLLLTFLCDVEAFATVTPKKVRLYGSPGQSIKSKVTVVPGEKTRFRIVDAIMKIGKNIRIQLEEEEKSGKRFYLLTVENLKKKSGRYADGDLPENG